MDSARFCVFTAFAWTLERDFNLKAGITAADDTLPARLLKEAAKTGYLNLQFKEVMRFLK